jgi:hypothetical protein
MKILLLTLLSFVYLEFVKSNIIQESNHSYLGHFNHSHTFSNSQHRINILKGVVLSNNEVRYNSTKKCLIKTGFNHVISSPQYFHICLPTSM